MEDLIIFILGLIRSVSEKTSINVGMRIKVNSLLRFTNRYLCLSSKGELLPVSSYPSINATTRNDTILYLKYLASALKFLKNKRNEDYLTVCSKYSEVVMKELPLSKIKKYKDFFNSTGQLNYALKNMLFRCADALSSSAPSIPNHNLTIFSGRSRAKVEIQCPDDVPVESFRENLEHLLNGEGFDTSLMCYFKLVSSSDQMTYDFAKLRLDGGPQYVRASSFIVEDHAEKICFSLWNDGYQCSSCERRFQ